MLIALATARQYLYSHTQHSSFTARTTGVSNPVCSPGFRIIASVTDQQVAFATDVLPNIYAFHRYTGNSTCLFGTPAPQFRLLNTVKPHLFTADLRHSLHALYAQ